jgi:hypothetical protein
MTEITGAMLINAVKEISRENPYFKYPNTKSCRYFLFKDGTYVPDCLLGHAFAMLNFPVTKIISLNEYGIVDVVSALEIPVTADELDWLSTVQDRQDDGHCWEDSVNE